jgi:hypothetical protein
MTTKEKIIKQYSDNIELVKKIEALMIQVDIQGDNKRDMLLAGFSRNLLSHFLSISFLMEKQLYNSAFALERVLFENVIKLKYMYYIMEDRKITTIYDANSWDKHFPTIADMTEKIDKVTGIEFYKKIKDSTYKVMCDYTHTGANQIARNFSDTDPAVEANFSDELILDTLEGNKQLIQTSIIVFMESIGLKNGFLTEQDMKDFLNY